LKEQLQLATNRILAAVDEQQPVAVFGLFSGGHDSLSAMYAARETDLMTAAVHINTGIGVPATREFVRDTANDLKVTLIELKAVENTNRKGELDPQCYRDLVLEYGFPGPAGHGMMYQRLKERALNRLARMFEASTRKRRLNPKVKGVFAPSRRIMLVAGCRSQESVRRMGNTKEVDVQGRFVWVNAIHDWTKVHTSSLIEHARLSRNLVVDLIHKSGECLCGAFAKEGEKEELNQWDLTRPAYNHIIKLEAEARAAGVYAEWGKRPPKKCASTNKPVGPLCWSCDKAVERDGLTTTNVDD